jgi:hypothetical protein
MSRTSSPGCPARACRRGGGTCGLFSIAVQATTIQFYFFSFILHPLVLSLRSAGEEISPYACGGRFNCVNWEARVRNVGFHRRAFALLRSFAPCLTPGPPNLAHTRFLCPWDEILRIGDKILRCGLGAFQALISPFTRPENLSSGRGISPSHSKTGSSGCLSFQSATISAMVMPMLPGLVTLPVKAPGTLSALLMLVSRRRPTRSVPSV